MLQPILDKLKNDSKYNHIFDSKEKMSVVMLSTGYYRIYEKGKIMFMILLGNEPKLLLKFYKLGGNMIRQEFDIQKTMYEKCANIISEPIEILHVNDFEIMIEKAYLGKSLQRYFLDNPFKNEIQSVMKNVFAIHAFMHKVQKPSTYDEFEKELKILIDKFNKSYCPNDKELSTINECVLILLEHFKNEKIYKRLSNGDFTPRNLIVNNSTIKIIDFEFAEETHLYFLDWFRFFKIQYALPNKYLYEILHAKIEDKYCLSALREYSNYYSKDRMDIACKLVSEIKEFVMRLPLHSHVFHDDLKKEIQPLISEIYSRLNEQGQGSYVVNPCELSKDSSFEKLSSWLEIMSETVFKDILPQNAQRFTYGKALSKLLEVYLVRRDLQKAFPDISTHQGLLQLLLWAIEYGIKEYSSFASYIDIYKKCASDEGKLAFETELMIPEWNYAMFYLLVVYFERGDLQKAFPEVRDNHNISNLIRWAHEYGIREDSRLTSYADYYEKHCNSETTDKPA